jgi:hypothetical protein
VRVRRIPRLKLEYQIARPLFVRLVGEYDAVKVDSLRDDSRTGGALLVPDDQGNLVRSSAFASNVFRGDFLFSYQPLPGTVVFVGYGSVMDEPRVFRFGGLERRTDGWFIKGSYLFRL